MDFTLFVARIGILAFLLAIRMSIAANIVTPRIAAWWAVTSRARRGRRVELLRMRVVAYRHLLRPDQRHESFVRAVRSIVYVLVGFTYLTSAPTISVFWIHGALNRAGLVESKIIGPFGGKGPLTEVVSRYLFGFDMRMIVYMVFAFMILSNAIGAMRHLRSGPNSVDSSRSCESIWDRKIELIRVWNPAPSWLSQTVKS